MQRRCPRCRTYAEVDICPRCGRYTLPIDICPKCFNDKQERNVGHRIITTKSRFTKEGEFAWTYDINEHQKVFLYCCGVCKHNYRGEPYGKHD